MAKKKQNQKDTPKVNPELEGFDIRIDPFGEIKTNYNIDKINEFLNKNVDDKKLRDRDDLFPEEKEVDPPVEDDELEDDDHIKNEFVDISEDELEGDDMEEGNDPEEEYPLSDDFDDFTIEDEDDLK